MPSQDIVACARAPGGWIYDEREVNGILGGFHEDTAQPRRLLVDEGLLARDAGRYWKARPELEADASEDASRAVSAISGPRGRGMPRHY